MADNLKRKCFKCGRSPSEQADIKLYRFPNPGPTNIQRCEMWAKFCFPDGAWSSVQLQKKLYGEHRMLCNRHFKQEAFTDFANKKLNRHAIPNPEEYENQLHSSIIDIMVGQSRLSHNPPEGAIPGPSQITVDVTDNQMHQTLPAVITESAELTGQSCHTPVPVPVLSDVAGPSQIFMDITNIQKPEIMSAPDKAKNIIPSDITPVSLPKPSKMSIVRTVEQTPTILTASDTSPNNKVMKNPLYKKCRNLMKKVCHLKNKIKKMNTKGTLNVINDNAEVNNLMKRITPALALILQGEIKNAKRKHRGRRWTEEQKIIALRLYKRSAAGYRLLRRLWCLPAPTTLKKMLGHFHLNVGINEKALKSLKKYVGSQDPSNNEFVMMFDEMAIKKHLWYNPKFDKVEGFQDHGHDHGRTNEEAVHALVFMVAGIRKKIKMPVAFYLSSANVTADRLAVFIKEVLHKCNQFGLRISTTVCDMGGVNRRALSLLGACKDTPYFSFEENEVVTMFDPPHLLKCFRNMLLKYDLKCTLANISSDDVEGQGVAKWEHIKHFYEVDNSTNRGTKNFVFAPKLRKEHLDPNNKQKMRVYLASQVFSHSVASGMFYAVAKGLLPAEATVTADVVSEMDKLFDCVNSDSNDMQKGKPHATNMTEVSPHSQHLAKMRFFFENAEFIGCHSSPPSKQGWVWTINAIVKLYDNLKKRGIKSLATRRLQQDALENLFGTIRGNCGSNYNPTTGQFIGGLKTAIISNLAHMGSGNCEKDECSMIGDFKQILQKCTSTSICTDVPETVSDMLSLMENSFEESVSDSEELQACAYVCGFLLKTLKIDCDVCDTLLRSQSESGLHSFMGFKEYDDIKKRLNYASETFIKCVENCATVCNGLFLMSSYLPNLKQNTIAKLLEVVDFEFLSKCQVHFQKNVDFIVNSVFHICIKRFCTIKNRQYSDHSRALKRKIDIVTHK